MVQSDNLFNRFLPDEKAKVAALSVFSNTILVVFKLIAGLMINSVSVISEAIHSGLDLVAAMIAFFSVRTSSQPPDERHRYGHGKIENISGTIEAILIFIAAVWIIFEAYKKIVSGSTVETVGVGLVIMAISAVMNLIISTLLMKTARKTDSVALEADALHLRTDVYTSLGVFIGLAALEITKIQIFDPIIAIAVALMIIKAAYDLTVKAFVPLLDVSLPGEEEAEITNILELLRAEGKLVDYHKLRTRRAGRERHVDLHVVVPRNHPIHEVHQLCDQIEEDIEKRLPASNVLIHAEPCQDKYCSLCRSCPGNFSQLQNKER